MLILKEIMSESKRADDRFNLIAMLVFLPIAAILKVYFFFR